MAKIVFSELENWEEEILKRELKAHKLNFFKSPITLRNADKIKDAEILGIFIHTQINEKLLDKFKNLKLIIAMSVGFDHIDLDACRKRGVNVCNVPDYGTNTVAEHTIGLILTLSRNIHEAVDRTRNNNFSLKGLMGFDLQGKTLGVVGVGRIGKYVIKLAKGFGMNVIAFDPHPEKAFAKKIGFKFVSFNNLLRNSDIITLHCPLNEKTYHLINNKTIKIMKKGSYLINTARGGIIDVMALKYGLDNGILAGAGLDVLEGEREISEEKELLHKPLEEHDWKTLLCNHLLLKKHNVVVTPHCAFYSEEAVKRILSITIDIIKNFEKGKVENKIV